MSYNLPIQLNKKPVNLPYECHGLPHQRKQPPMKGEIMRRTAEIAYREYWVIRVVKDSTTRKKIIKEIEHETPPTEQDILDVLLNCEQDEFISVAHNYKLY